MLRRVVGAAVTAFLVALAVFAGAARAQVHRSSGADQPRLARAIAARLNAIRRGHGLAQLGVSRGLSGAAGQHTEEMGTRGYFAHASADHSAFWLRIRRWYPAAGWHRWSVGENLLWRAPTVGAADALGMWMASPEHRANILDPAWRQVGVFAARFPAAPGFFRGQTVTIVTVDFGVRQ